jgi:hypothetical protein
VSNLPLELSAQRDRESETSAQHKTISLGARGGREENTRYLHNRLAVYRRIMGFVRERCAASHRRQPLYFIHGATCGKFPAR